MHLNVRFSTETELKAIQDMLYEKSGQGVSFTGLVEAMAHEVTIVTAIHNIKSNKGSKTAGVDKMQMDKYLQMPKDELILLIQTCFRKYQPKPARREYIPKSNGKMRPLGIPTVLDRIIQECVRLIIEPICEARFYPHSYGFRPYRAQKHAIRDIINVINAGCKSPDQAVWAVEGDIQGCFDNISHRILLQKVWRMGIHDKRVLKIISQMLKAGYIERDLYHKTETGTPQGGILSPLLSNIYLNDFDWYVGRTYMEPHRKCKHKCNDTRRLKWAGTTPKYNFRYADDWVVLTSTEKEAFRMKRELTKYFRQKLKLELSQEKTYVTDLRKGGIHFIGYIVKAERKRKTPDPATWTEHLVGKPLPDMERLSKKIASLLEQVHRIELYSKPNTQAAQIQSQFNSIINYANSKGYLHQNPLADIKNMGIKDKRVEFWNTSEYERFAYYAMKYPNYYYAFEVLYWCGLREGEMLALTLQDIDLEQAVIYVNKTYQRFHRQDIISTPKTPSSVRKVSMPAFLCDELREYIDMLYFPAPDQRIFTITKSKLTNRFHKLSEEAGLRRITVHGLRHSHVSLLISKKYDIFEVSKRIGHKSIKTTQDIYGHLFDEVQKTIANDLDSLRRR